MTRAILYQLVIIFLIFLLSIERSFGLPVLFFSLITIFFSRIARGQQALVSIFLGMIFGVLYVLPFWLAVGLVASNLFFFDRLKKVITSSSLRLLLIVFLSNIVIFQVKTFYPDFLFIFYHLVVLLILLTIMFFMAGIGVNKNNMKLSKRFKDEVRF